jgi:hypothetical protein
MAHKQKAHKQKSANPGRYRGPLVDLILSRRLASSTKLVLLALAELGSSRGSTWVEGTHARHAAEVSASRLARLVGLHRVTV